MERIAKAEGLDDVPKPCDYFDLIGGTSTGGIIAIMLGRLSMTVNDCIRAYDKVAELAFTPKWHLPVAPPKGAYSAQNLEYAIKQTVKEFCTEDSCVALRSKGTPTTGICEHDDLEFRSNSCTKTAVLAITKDNVDAPPTLFTTYDTSARHQGCTIWQVARATSAATTFFKSIQLGRDNINYIDAGFGYNNPCEVLIEEARRQFPTSDQLKILSIGTGLGSIVTIKDKRWYIIKALKSMATNSSKVANRLDRQYSETGYYHRFNVSRGLEDISLSDWDKTSSISAHTTNYIMENQRAFERFVVSFLQSPIAQSEVPDASNETLSISTHFCIPFPKNKRFVGRDAVLAKLKEMYFMGNCQQVALVGLGGIGKTQVAIQFAYWVKENKPEYSIFWVPALSHSSFEQAYTDIARDLSIGKGLENESIMDSVRRYLNSERAGKWFLIVDNADDVDILYGSPGTAKGMNQYLPRSENGITLFTTRSRDVAQSCAENNAIELAQMDHQEALSFLKTSLDLNAVEYEEGAASDLLHELGFLPLAIKQAIAYLNISKLPIREYLRLLRNTEQNMVDLMSREFCGDFQYQNSQKAIATTWLVSFDRISDNQNAAHILEFISRIEPKAIPQSILPSLQSERRLLDAIGTLCSYAFLIRRGREDTFDMHRLVHLGARIWIQRRNLTTRVTCNAILHLKKTYPPPDYMYQKLWQTYLPHALKVLYESSEHCFEERYWLCLDVGQTLHKESRIKESIWALEETYRWALKHLPDDSPLLLASGDGLATAYTDDDRNKEAIELFEHIITIKRRILGDNVEHIAPVNTKIPGEDHVGLSLSLYLVSRAYLRNGQIKEATMIAERVALFRKETLPENDPGRLAVEHTLGYIYLEQNRVKDAVEIFEHVVAVQRMLPMEHYNRLATEHELARVYLEDDRVNDAIKLFEHVVSVKKILPKEHPGRLASGKCLASAYARKGLVKDAIQLYEQVVAIRKMLPEDNRSRIESETQLGIAYLLNNQVESNQAERAIELLSANIKIMEETFKADDPCMIQSKKGLEYAYGILEKQQL